MRSVLIVDDDAEYRQGLKVFLSKNYEVLEAANGNDGLLLLNQKPVDLVITDILMPDREGIETIQAMRRQRPDLKIIVISAVDSVTLRIAERMGENATFSKSASFELLAEMIDRVARE